MDGLDAWITGEGRCTYCGQYFPCHCETAEDEEPAEQDESEDCMDCGMCDSCIERTREFFESMENDD